MDLLTRRRAILAQRKIEKEEYFFPEAAIAQLTGNTLNGKACQGGCVVGSKWYVTSINADDSEQYLSCFDMTNKTLTIHKTYSTLGHANSLTYNNRENVLYSATGYANLGLAVISAETFEHARTFTLHRLDGSTYAPWQVTYDRKRNLIYSLAGATTCRIMIINSTSGDAIAEKPFRGWIERTTAQGIETDGEYFYMIWSSPNNVIDVYTLDGQFLTTVEIPNPGIPYFEIEEIGYDWSGMFYVQAFTGASGNFKLYTLLLRTFDGWANMANAPFGLGVKRETNAIVSILGDNSLQITSSGAKSYNMYFIGTAFPLGYEFLKGKTCRVTYNLSRISGTTGQFATNIFTADSQTIPTLGNRLFQVSDYRTLESGSKPIAYEFVMGEGRYTPAAGKEGTYVGYAIFLYADSGNAFRADDFKFEVRLA